MQTRWDEADRLRRLQVDRARYESELARRRFLRVDPDNRLVAASLEAEWNVKLRALAQAEQNYDRQRQADQFKISATQREQVLGLATDFPRLWNDPGTANRERKRMVRLLIEDITIRKGDQVQLDVRFRGGILKTLMLPRPLSFCESHKQNPALVAEMDRLLEDYNYADTARILNERPADHIRNGKDMRDFNKNDRTLATKGSGPRTCRERPGPVPLRTSGTKPSKKTQP
jgi:hypothetical protein